MADGIVGRRVRFDHNDHEDEGLVMSARGGAEGFFLLIMTEDGDLATSEAGKAIVLADESDGQDPEKTQSDGNGSVDKSMVMEIVAAAIRSHQSPLLNDVTVESDGAEVIITTDDGELQVWVLDLNSIIETDPPPE